jgi:hypothetical protein
LLIVLQEALKPLFNVPLNQQLIKYLCTESTMDRETLNEMVKLKFGVRKAGGPTIDLVKLAGNGVYADEIFSIVENLPDESLVMLAMTLRDKFGLLADKPVAPAPAQEVVKPAAVKPTAAVPEQRYMAGARS